MNALEDLMMMGSGKSAEGLSSLGKRASAGWHTGQYDNLTRAVADTIKDAGLNSEQVRRVVEEANKAAYLSEFSKEGQSHKVISFEGGPASAIAVLDMLDLPTYTEVSKSASIRSTNMHVTNSEGGTKTASLCNKEEQALADMFKVANAPPEYPEYDPLREAYDLHQDLASTSAKLASDIDALESAYHGVTADLYQQIKKASYDGVELGEMLQAWQTVTPSLDHVKVAFEELAPRLIDNGVYCSVSALEQSIEKTGSARQVNMEHPLVSSFSNYCGVLDELAQVKAAKAEVDTNDAELFGFLKNAGVLGMVGKAHGAVKGLADRAAPHVAEAFGSPHAGTAVRWAGRLAVPAVGIIAANEVRRRMAGHPITQAVSAVIPGTEAYARKQYEIDARNQSGGMY